MTLLSVLPDADAYDIKILATDIDFRMVQAAREGGHADGVPPAMRDRWMTRLPGRDAGAWCVKEPLRDLVSFRELNLLEAWPMKGRFDAVFCRNVCIYFDEPTQNGLWRRFADALVPSGVLYIGHSERIGGEAASRFRSDSVTSYRHVEGAR